MASAAALAGCDGGSVFGESTAPPADGDDVVPTAATLTLIASSPQLSSNAVATANGITLTATVKDANNVIIQGATVGFSTTDTGANLTVTQPTTDASGVAQATLTIGSSKANRAIVINASSGSATGSVTVNVVGTSITLSGPSSGQFGTAATYVATLTDSGGAGIAGQSVTLASSGGSFTPASPLTTDTSGQVTFSFTPTTSATSTSLTVSALGVSASQDVALSQDSFAFTAPTTNQEINLGATQAVTVRWTRSGSAVSGATVEFSATRGTLSATTATTNASGDATVSINSTQAGFATIQANGTSGATSATASIVAEFIATVPATIEVQVDPAVISTNQTSTVTAVVRDASNNLVKNRVVTFGLVDTTGGQLSASSATTNSQGVASVVYQASSSPSAQNGVTLSACAAACGTGSAISDSATLTVGARAARIVLGTGNEIFEPDPTFYEFPYVAIVTDNAGNPAPDADLRLTIAPTFYSKGYYVENTDGDLVPFETARCPSEDLNLNGILDAGEDTDNDGLLDPTNIAQVPQSLDLDENGTATFNIRYPQEYGNWTRVRLTAKATVSGTESTEIANFLLPISEDDADNPPGNPSPYGVIARCDLDDTAAPQVSFSSATTNLSGDEADADLNKIFTVVLDRVFTEDVIVPLVYDEASTASNADFTAVPQSVTVPAGMTSANFTITIADDTTPEPDAEFLFIIIGNPSNAIAGGNRFATLTITSDE